MLKRVTGDDVVGVVISLACGYIGYLPAEEMGVSGVLAAVTVGVIVGHRSSDVSTASSRLRGYAFWEVFVFLVNSVLFVLVGLQLPEILSNQDRSPAELAGLALLVSGAVVGTRLLWLNTLPYVIRAVDRRAAQVARRVGWRLRLIGAWSGLRGAVSLAAALALPSDFPERDLLIFLTLCVIFATLVVQGLTLPWLIRRLEVEDDGAGELEELHARREATEAAIAELRRLAGEDWTRDDTVERMLALYSFRNRRLSQRAGASDGDEDDNLDERSRAYQRLVREVLDAQRRRVVELARRGGDLRRGAPHAGARVRSRGPAARDLTPRARATYPCAGVLRLVTIPISHYCEKARWALERAGIPYREERHVQGIHRFAARRAGGGQTVPVLVTPEGSIGESEEILRWADERTPPERRLFPSDPTERAEVEALSRRFDERLGPRGRRFMYVKMLAQSELMIRFNDQGVPALGGPRAANGLAAGRALPGTCAGHPAGGGGGGRGRGVERARLRGRAARGRQATPCRGALQRRGPDLRGVVRGRGGAARLRSPASSARGAAAGDGLVREEHPGPPGGALRTRPVRGATG